MKFVIQRVSSASVSINQNIVGNIKKGYLVLVGISDTDTKETAEKLVRKMIALRIFEDENGKTNLSLADVKGSVLLVSQFTLYADCRRGNRPSFTNAGSPAHAEELYNDIISLCSGQLADTQKGMFGADMKVSLVNDGPFTIILDSDEL